MKIAYVCYWNVFANDGVARKITSQAEQWREAGHTVDVFALSPHAAGAEQQWPARPFVFAGAAERVRASLRLVLALRRFRPDVVYLRYDLFPPPFYAIHRLFPTVVELNSDEHAEYRHRGRRARLADRYGRANWRLVLGRAAGIVCVTNEIVALVARYGRPTAVIANGIDLSGIEPAAPLASGRPTLLFSGSPGQPWHGVDKLVALARACPQLDLVLLGVTPESLPANVTAPGYLPREEYEPLLARCDAAVGTAAFHRNGMEEGCPLKVREYLAYGLPVVLPYDDTDLRGLDEWFVLRLPNTETNLVDHAAEIAAFVAEVRGRRVPREAIAGRVGNPGKEARRLAFLEQAVARP